MRSKVFTMPEFLEKRFSPTARTMLSVISLIAYILTKIAVGIFAGGIVFSVLLPELHLNLFGLYLDSFWVGSVLVIVLTGIYTVIGGLRAVAYTEAIQTIVLIIGSILVTFFGLKALGGWSELRAVLGSEMFNLWKPLVPAGVEGTWAPVQQVVQEIGANGVAVEKVVKQAWYFNDNYPWLGMLFCAPIVGLWYWCTDQYIVQRALGAPNEQQARRGSIWASFLKLLPVFIFIIPGMICIALASSGNLTAEIAEKVIPIKNTIFNGQGEVIVDEAQKAFPLMVSTILPTGIRGIVVAGLLAALMSSLAGVFNASSTLFTMDFYSRFRPKASQHQLVWIGRVATAVMVLIGLAWIPVIKGGKGLYDYLQGVQAYLAPPIFVVFFMGVFNKRLNAKGCLSAMIVGFILGLSRLIIDTPVKLMHDFSYAKGSFFWIVNHIYFQYFSIIIFVVCVVVMVVVSHLTAAPKYDHIGGLTYGTVSMEDKKKSRSSWSRIDVIASVLLVVIIVAIYLYFRG
jgi:SSS family solute:Na+ symporter